MAVPAAVLVRVINAVGGGLLRDIIAREEPLVFKPGQFYVLTALGGAVVFVSLSVHLAEDLKNTGKGNLFVIFGEPDIALLADKDGRIRVKVNGVDVLDPSTGEVRSDGADSIAGWFIDTDYNEESFFVRHADFLGANDPYTSLNTTLKAEIDVAAFVLERDHKLWISMRFDNLALPPIEVLDIPDNFGVMDPELQKVLQSLLDPEIERFLENRLKRDEGPL